MIKPVKFICDYLSAKGMLAPEQRQKAYALQTKSHTSMEAVLRDMGIVLDDPANEIIAEQIGIELKSLNELAIHQLLLHVVEPGFAHRHRLIPLAQTESGLAIALDNLLNYLGLDYLSKILGRQLEPVLISRTDMNTLLLRHYPLPEESRPETVSAPEEAESSLGEEAPVIQLVNKLVADAYQKRASDIHIEPMAKNLRIRFRIDGLLQEMQSPERRLQASIISRIKLMAGMNIAEKRLPQDGRIRTVVEKREFDLRVSSLPATHGESVVLRILDRRSLRIEEIGLAPEQLTRFIPVINAPNGIILVTGPTGSGKSTTLYSVLSSVDRSRKKILTAEDPVEYQIAGINQVQVRTHIGLSFVSILRSMLRQAPDIIMVGEIRDLETARIAIQAALTGHLIFSTLHTNDAPGAITRLIDMGMEPFLVSSTLQAVLAQRLLRLLCSECKQSYSVPKDERKMLNYKGAEPDLLLYRARGCPACGHTGYLGRNGIFELLVMDDELRELVHDNSALSHVRERARRQGMLTLKEHAVRKVLEGVTTVQEMVRVTQSDIEC